MEIMLTASIFGHDKAIQMLSQALVLDRIPQSLLVVGLPHVGKTTLAFHFAMALNCTQKKKPCGQCDACRKIKNQTHPDVTLLDNGQETLKIEQIRELQRELSLKAREGRYKVAVLCNFERATTAAANALLKTLEEPPPYTVLLLTAQNPNQLLPTIVSRCRVVTLRPIADSVIREALVSHWEATHEQATLLSRLATGRLGWAVTALIDPESLTRREEYLSELYEVMHQGEAHRLAYAAGLSKKQETIPERLNLWLTWWRDVMLLSQHADAHIINLDYRENLYVVAQNLSQAQILKAIKQTHQAQKYLNYNVNLRLNLEAMLLNMPLLT